MLTDAHKARLRATQRATLPLRAAIWRTPPAPAGGKSPAPAPIADAVPCQIWPAAEAQKLTAAMPDLGGGRSSHVGFLLDDADLQSGDELRVATGRYKVLGVGYWSTLLVAGLSELPHAP